MTLKLVEDQGRFDRHQAELLKQLVGTISDSLEQAEISVPEDDAGNFIGILSFNISALLDGSTVAGSPDKPAMPYLTFRQDEGSDTLIVSSVGSYMHEISEGVVDEVLGEAAEAADSNIDDVIISEGLDGEYQFFITSNAGELEIWLFPGADEEDALDILLSALGDNLDVGRAFAEPFVEAIQSVEVIRHVSEKASKRKSVDGWEAAKASGIGGLCKLLTKSVE